MLHFRANCFTGRKFVDSSPITKFFFGGGEWRAISFSPRRHWWWWCAFACGQTRTATSTRTRRSRSVVRPGLRRPGPHHTLWPETLSIGQWFQRHMLRLTVTPRNTLVLARFVFSHCQLLLIHEWQSTGRHGSKQNNTNRQHTHTCVTICTIIIETSYG